MFCVVGAEELIDVVGAGEPVGVHVAHLAAAGGEVMGEVPTQSKADLGLFSGCNLYGGGECTGAPDESRSGALAKEISTDFLE